MTPGNSQMDAVTLKLDNGSTLDFCGRLFSETAWYDEEAGALSTQKLYVTETNEQVYSIVSGNGRKRERRAYRIAMRDGLCHVSNGRSEMSIPVEMLMFAVRSLCGLQEGASSETLEEILRAANC